MSTLFRTALYSGPVVLQSQNTSSTFVRMRAHGCVCVCNFVPFLKCTSFQHSKRRYCWIYVKEICNPKFIYFPTERVRLPHDCEMEQNIQIDDSLTPCLTLRRALSIFLSPINMWVLNIRIFSGLYSLPIKTQEDWLCIVFIQKEKENLQQSTPMILHLVVYSN